MAKGQKAEPDIAVDKKRTIVDGLKRRTLVADDIYVSPVKTREASSTMLSGGAGVSAWRTNDPDRRDPIKTGDWDHGSGCDPIKYTDMDTRDNGPHPKL